MDFYHSASAFSTFYDLKRVAEEPPPSSNTQPRFFATSPCILPCHLVHSDTLLSNASLSLIPVPAVSEPKSGAAYREERESKGLFDDSHSYDHQ